MKGIQLMIGLLFLTMSCVSSQNSPLKYADEVDGKGKTVFDNGSVTITNPEVEYEVIIFDNQFERWFVTQAPPKRLLQQNLFRNEKQTVGTAI